ncbi:MAG: RNA 2'-phosphotransferase [Christensenellales bacterium]|jgi:putative RNA 2'-phosphotransferase
MEQRLSIYLCKLLRHQPELAHLQMDKHGWVSVNNLIAGVNAHSQFRLDRQRLTALVQADKKGRYRFDETGARIKCCQGHSIPWVEPELTDGPPPDVLYHGTTQQAWESIRRTGAILKMKRHGVHMQSDAQKAWASATRHRRQTPVLLAIDARAMAQDGMVFGVSDNQVWCTERVPIAYVCGVYDDPAGL